MKVIRIIFFTLLAFVLIAGAGIFIFFETFDADQYLPEITRQASQVLGRPVSVGHVGLGLSRQGISLDAGPLIIADDLNFTKQPFITVDKVRVSLDLKPLILRREIHITTILLQSPQIHIIRSQDGNINVQSIGQKSQSTPSVILSEAKDLNKNNSLKDSSPLGLRMTAKETVSNSISKEHVLFGDLTVKSIKIQDASISFIDQSQTMPLDIWLTNISTNLNDVSLSPSGELTAKGEIIIAQGVIKNFNIIKTALSHTLGVFGGIDDNIDNLLNGKLKSKLGTDDTILEKAEAKFSLHDKAIFIDESLIQTNIFELTAKGSVDQGLNTDIQTMLHLNADVSALLVNELDGLKLLCDDSKRIAIDASLTGVIPRLKYKPNKDFRKKSKQMLMEEGGNILGALLGGGQTSTQGQDTPSQDTGVKIKKNFKNIFKSLLQ